ncbi:hypothetical protein PV04_03288 [Phialophora macrospora]|uniref:Uncharacterized protein n=1 Tax=Phialophora macrospora TaxID=1851006 RepID=A0A0D2FX94_9EURO|nr:hypothetical protein PV04_03288 [Phialophora macrospora]
MHAEINIYQMSLTMNGTYARQTGSSHHCDSLGLISLNLSLSLSLSLNNNTPEAPEDNGLTRTRKNKTIMATLETTDNTASRTDNVVHAKGAEWAHGHESLDWHCPAPHTFVYRDVGGGQIEADVYVSDASVSVDQHQSTKRRRRVAVDPC